MPDITPAQIGAVVKFLVVLVGMLGLNIDGETSDAITAALVAISAAVSLTIIAADAVIRANRAKMKAAGGAPDALVSDR
jgi:hypothetical protein